MSGGEQDGREKCIVMLLQNKLPVSSSLCLRDLLNQYLISDEFILVELFSLSPNSCIVLVLTMPFDKEFFCLTTLTTIPFLFVCNLPLTNIMGRPLTLVLGQGQSLLSICPLLGTQDFIHLQYIFPLLFLFRLKVPPLVGKQFHTCANLPWAFSNSIMSFLRRVAETVHSVQDTDVH